MQAPALDRRSRPHQLGGAALIGLGLVCLLWALLAPRADASIATGLRAELGQSPMPSRTVPLLSVRESCKGIAPTSGSREATTQKELNEGQGIIDPGASTYTAGGTVHWIVGYHASESSRRFQIRDCVVSFFPDNPQRSAVLALVDAGDHGQLVPQPGSSGALKSFDRVLDTAVFSFPDRVALPGELDIAWTVPSGLAPGTLVCNYAKDTGGTTAGSKENRKAGGACFVVPGGSTTSSSSSTSTSSSSSTSSTSTSSTSSTSTSSTSSTTSSSTSSTTSSTVPPTTSSTAGPASTVTTTSTTVGPAAGTTTVPDGQRDRLPFTGGTSRALLGATGVALLALGLAVLVLERQQRFGRSGR